MSKGRKKKVVKGEEEKITPLPLDIVPDKVYCTCVGHTMMPSGQNWSDNVKSSKVVNGALLLHFENKNFTCDNRTCKLVPDNKSEGDK